MEKNLKNIKDLNIIKKTKYNKIIYKCVYNINMEKIRSQTSNRTHKSFCNATIEYIIPDKTNKAKYILKEGHSSEYINLLKANTNKKKTSINTKAIFIKFCIEVLNSSNIYARNLFKEQIKDIYNQNRFDFGINNNLFSNIITKWKYTSNKFNKSTVLKNMFYYDSRLILREFRNIILGPEKSSKKPLNIGL